MTNCESYFFQFLIIHLSNLFQSLLSALFSAMGFACFLAAIQCHQLTKHVANYRESLFTLVILEENLGFSFWLCVASAVTHGANILVVASSKIHLPKIQTKKPEEPSATGEDFLY